MLLMLGHPLHSTTMGHYDYCWVTKHCRSCMPSYGSNKRQ
jgi:hypothetical protein